MKRNKNQVILQKKMLLIYVFLLAAMPPYRLTELYFLNYIFDVLQCIGILYMICSIIRKKNVSKLLLGLLGFEGLLIVATVIGQQNLYECFATILNQLSMPVLLVYCIPNRAEMCIEASYKYYYTLSVVNFLYVIFGYYIQGVAADDSLFITEANSMTPALIYSLILTSLYNTLYLKKRKILDIKLIFLIIINSITEIIVWSATGMIGYFFVVFSLIYYGSKGFKKKIAFYSLSGMIIILTLGIVLFKVQENFGFLIEGVLNKSVNFTGRASIWEVNIERITQSPIYGYGYGYRAIGYFYAHNGWLELLIEGGITLLTAFCLLVISAVNKHRSATLGESQLQASNLLLVALLSFEIMMITEFPHLSYTFSMLVILYHMKSFDKSGVINT